MEEKLLCGIIPVSIGDRDHVLDAKKNLLKLLEKDVQFKEEIPNILFKVVAAFFKATKGFFDLDQLKDILVDNGLDPEKLGRVLMLFDESSKTSMPEEKFDFYLDRYIENAKRNIFESTLLTALSTLNGSSSLEEGKTALVKAKELIIPQLFDSEMISKDTPHGNIMIERDELLLEYEEAKKTEGKTGGLQTGFTLVDEAFQGMFPGQLIVVAAASGEGKSFFAANVAWHVAVVQKKHVVIITAETLRAQYRRRIMCRHSNMAKFGCPIEIEKLKRGSLSEEEEEVYKMVIDDFTSGEYGTIELSQVSNGTTLGDLRIYLERLSMTQPIDLVILDYLSLLKPTRKRSSQREEAVELFKEAKELAVTFNKGKGIPLLTLHQIGNDAREKAKFLPGKFYTLRSLADSSEAGKSADSALAILRTEEMEEEHELGAGIIKTRDSGVQTKLFRLYENYATSYVGDLDEAD